MDEQAGARVVPSSVWLGVEVQIESSLDEVNMECVMMETPASTRVGLEPRARDSLLKVSEILQKKKTSLIGAQDGGKIIPFPVWIIQFHI